MRFTTASLGTLLLAAVAGCSAAGPDGSEQLGAAGQAATAGTIAGTVTTSTGAPIAGATVKLQGASSGIAVTNSAGQYSVSATVQGNYTVTVSLANCTFWPSVVNNVWPGTTENFTGSGSGCSGTTSSWTTSSGSSSSGSSGGTSTGTSSGTATTTSSCPQPDGTDSQERAAATVALQLMQGAAQMGGPVAPVFSNTILAAQRYRIQSSGTGIEFDPNDPLYPYVSSQMKAALGFAQLDSTVAQYLTAGLQYAYANSNGWYFPSVDSVAALASFKYPTGTTVHIADNTSQNNSHQATASGSPWCGTEMVTILETVQESYSFSPLYSVEITNPGVSIGGGWLNAPPTTFHGSSNRPYTPFNGASASGNPYLVVSVNGASTNWATYNFTPANCWSYPSDQCTGTLQIDPVPYAEPGQYYDVNGNMMGTQSAPFTLVGTLYAVPDHQSQWATRVINGVQEWGTFTTPVTLYGFTEYKYVKQM